MKEKEYSELLRFLRHLCDGNDLTLDVNDSRGPHVSIVVSKKTENGRERVASFVIRRDKKTIPPASLRKMLRHMKQTLSLMTAAGASMALRDLLQKIIENFEKWAG